MTPFNIVHVLDERWDSAITEYGLSLSVALQKRGHRVFVWAKKNKYAYQEAQKRGLSVYSLGSILKFHQFIKKEKINIVNCHTGSGHFLGVLSRLSRNCALVRTRGDARSLKKNWGHRVLYQRTDAVIGGTVLLSDQYRKLYPSLNDRVETIYPGLTIPDYLPEPKGPLRFSLVGRLDPVKGQIYFLEAIALLKNRLTDEEFYIVGEEKNTPLSDLKSRVDRMGISKWVRFEGKLSNIEEFMKNSHVGVICSIGSEALSRVCLEWMTQSRPVIATAVGCLPEFISTGENGFLVPSHSETALSNCFLGMIENQGFRREMGKKAYQMAKNRFNLEKFASETEKVYEKSLKRRKALF